jgi:hypothetical protein
MNSEMTSTAACRHLIVYYEAVRLATAPFGDGSR